MMSDVKCTCGRRTPFAHNHAVECPVFNPQMPGRSQRPQAVDLSFKPDDIKLVNPGNGEYDREQVEALMREQQTVGRVARVHPAVDDVEAQLAKDYALYGCSYHTVDDQGRKTRIDPTKLRIQCRGITSDTQEVQYPPVCQHDWMISAAYDNTLICTKCEATRSAV